MGDEARKLGCGLECEMALDAKLSVRDDLSGDVYLMDLGLLLPWNCVSLHVGQQVSGRLDSKESACNAGGLGLIPGLGRVLREQNG